MKRYFLIFLAALFGLVSTTYATEMSGHVDAVAGEKITIRFDTENVGSIGDIAEVTFVMIDGNPRLVGKWRIESVEGLLAVAGPLEVNEEPGIGQLAVIHDPIPKKKEVPSGWEENGQEKNEPAARKVPRLGGLSLLDAKESLERAGLKISVNLQSAAPNPNNVGRVSKQDPAPGSDAAEAAVVEVWVYGDYEETAREYCGLGKSSFPYQPDHDYYVFRNRQPRKVTNRHYSREYGFIPDNAYNLENTLRNIQQEGKMDLVFKGRLPGLCPHLRKNCAYSSLNDADSTFFGDICGKWEDPPPVYVSRKSATTVPDLRGETVVSARETTARLGMGISVELGEPAASRNNVNLIYKQSPEPGMEAADGGSVTIWIYGDIENVGAQSVAPSTSPGFIPGGIPQIEFPLSVGNLRNWFIHADGYTDKSGRWENGIMRYGIWKDGIMRRPEQFARPHSYRGTREVRVGYNYPRPREGINLVTMVFTIRWLAADDPDLTEKNARSYLNPSQSLDLTSAGFIPSKQKVSRSKPTLAVISIISPTHMVHLYGELKAVYDRDSDAIDYHMPFMEDLAHRIFQQVEPYCKPRNR